MAARGSQYLRRYFLAVFMRKSRADGHSTNGHAVRDFESGVGQDFERGLGGSRMKMGIEGVDPENHFGRRRTDAGERHALFPAIAGKVREQIS